MEIRKIKFAWSQSYSVFASEKFLKSQSSDYGWLGGFNGEKLRFVLPYNIKKKLIFKYLIFQTGTIYIDERATTIDEKQFLNEVIVFLRKEKIDFIAHPTSYVLFRTYPEKSIYAPFGTYLVDLSKDEDELLKDMSQNHKRQIKAASKNSIEIKRTHEYDNEVFEMLSKTMDRSNMNFTTKEYFNNIIASLGSNVEVFIAEKDGKIQGAAVFPYSKFSSFYLWGGSADDIATGAMHLLHWEAMRYFKSMGVKMHNFVGARLKPDEGSKLAGIQRFKGGFGSVLEGGVLWKFPLNNLKFNLFNLLIKIKNFGTKSSKDIIDQEREKIEKQKNNSAGV
jgi:hypothetical protein